MGYAGYHREDSGNLPPLWLRATSVTCAVTCGFTQGSGQKVLGSRVADLWVLQTTPPMKNSKNSIVPLLSLPLEAPAFAMAPG